MNCVSEDEWYRSVRGREVDGDVVQRGLGDG